MVCTKNISALQGLLVVCASHPRNLIVLYFVSHCFGQTVKQMQGMRLWYNHLIMRFLSRL